MSEVRIIRQGERDAGTAQTPGMKRFAGVAPSTCESTCVWMGEVILDAGFRSGAHHHGEVESAIYVASGTLRFRWGAQLEHAGDAAAGDFIFVPAGVVHQEINASGADAVVTIVARGGPENIVVNVELPEADED
jgi:uncharacterized RmlC-like cupin family protein